MIKISRERLQWLNWTGAIALVFVIALVIFDCLLPSYDVKGILDLSLKTTLAVVATWGLIVGAKRLSTLNRQYDATLEEHKLARKQDIHRQYIDAVTLLGNKNDGAQVGGIHALKELFPERKELRKKIFIVLVDYLRETSWEAIRQSKREDMKEMPYFLANEAKKAKGKKERKEFEESKKKKFEDLEKVITPWKYKSGLTMKCLFETSDCMHFQFREGHISGVDVENVILNLENMVFVNLIFRNVFMNKVNMRKSIFYDFKFLPSKENEENVSDLRLADFSESIMYKVDFTRSNMQEADLRGVRMKDVSFKDADLNGAIISPEHRELTCFKDAKESNVHVIKDLNAEVAEGQEPDWTIGGGALGRPRA